MRDRSGEAGILNDIGALYYNLGKMQDALDFYNQALGIARAASDQWLEATVLNNIGSVYSSRGEAKGASLLRRGANDRALYRRPPRGTEHTRQYRRLVDARMQLLVEARRMP